MGDGEKEVGVLDPIHKFVVVWAVITLSPFVLVPLLFWSGVAIVKVVMLLRRRVDDKAGS